MTNQQRPLRLTLGQITQVKDDRGNLTSVEYDMVGRRTAITNPDTGRTEYNYDANGNLTAKLTANYQRGREIKYDYVFNRLTRINYPLERIGVNSPLSIL